MKKVKLICTNNMDVCVRQDIRNNMLEKNIPIENEADDIVVDLFSVPGNKHQRNPPNLSFLSRLNSSFVSLDICGSSSTKSTKAAQRQNHNKYGGVIQDHDGVHDLDPSINLSMKRRTRRQIIIDNESDSDDDILLKIDKTPRNKVPEVTYSPDTGQREYIKYCKVLREIPISKFSRSLACNFISLKHEVVSGNPFKACAMALIHNAIATSVDLEGCGIGPEGARHIADVLLQNDTITELNLRRNKLGKEGLTSITKALKKNDTLKVLDLSDNEFQETDAKLIKDILLEGNLRELNISNNNFGKQGGRTIAEGLAQNNELLKLDMSWNQLRAEGAAVLGYSLMTNTVLEVLNVSWNGFDVPGCHALGHALDKNNSLRELDLGSNRINLTGLCKLLEGLRRNKSIEVLRLSDNPITNKGALELLHTIEKYDCGVNEIDLGKQPVDGDFVLKLKSMQEVRDITAKYGKVCYQSKDGNSNMEMDRTMYISGDPLTILLEFSRMKGLRVLDLFITLDIDGSHSVSWEEFREGITMSHLPIRAHDIDEVIQQMDIDRDGEINFSELIIAQKEHDGKVAKLLKKGQKSFDQSPVGEVHHQLHKWFEDKDVLLKT